MSTRVSLSAAASVRTVAGLLSLVLLAGVLGLAVPGAARADSAPLDPAVPVTTTADALPTVQINGVAWAQVVAGDTVYVAGRFSRVRPAGAAPGTQETVRNNLLAYDIRTGQLVTSFAPDLNGQALALAVSPDGRRLYVGGDFTLANGQSRNRVAAYDTATGALVAGWRPSVSGQVKAIAATGTTVYLGGGIAAVGSVSRTRLAAVSATTGALLPWAPVPGVGPTSGNRLPLFDSAGKAIPGTYDAAANARTSNDVLAIVLAGGSVVVAGRFDTLNGAKATGIGALDPGTGATRPFAVNQLISNQGVNSAIYSLSTDGTTVYGTGYDYYGPGNMESAFAAEAAGGRLVWASTCRGDTYSSHPLGGALYIASHVHQCGNIGAWAEFDPQQYRHASAFSTAAAATNGPYVFANTNFSGKPAPAVLHWWPSLAIGSSTGQNQAAWSVSGNDRYVVYGGEFPRVEGVAQQGLTRFALPGTAPSRVAPTAGGLTPTVTSQAPGTARVAWQTSTDPDNAALTYRVYRDGGTTPVHEVTATSSWWNRPSLSFTDRGLTAGTHTYRVGVVDPQGNRNTGGSTPVTVAAGSTPARSYVDVVRADGAGSLWSLGERSGTTAFDQAGAADLTVGTGVARGQAGALAGDADTAAAFNGTSAGLAATRTAVPAPQTFSIEAWVNTRSTAGGVIAEFGNRTTGIAPVHDRMLYMDRAGRLNAGVWQNANKVVTSPRAYNDGGWHHVVVTFRTGSMVLYVDGVQVASRTDVITGEPGHGYWRIGGGTSWETNAASWFNGRVDEVAVYPGVLGAAQVANHHTTGTTGRPVDGPPTAAFTSTVRDLTASFDGAASRDAEGPVTAWAWTFGDGTTGTGATATHTYAAAGTYPVRLTVTDAAGATASTERSVTVTAPPPNQLPTASFTSSTTGLTVAVDGTGSADPDGSVTGYAWSWGDGTTGTGSSATHTYAAAGTYPVALTVTDDRGATATATREVTVAPAEGPAPVAADTFNRSVTGGWGSADVGGPWTATAGGTRLAVTPGAGVLNLPAAGNNTGAQLTGVSATAVDVRTAFTLETAPTGNGTYVFVSGRRVGADEYRVVVRVLPDGRVGLTLSRRVGGTEAWPGGEVLLPAGTWTPGTALNARVQVSGTGTTTVKATVWPAGATEPGTPQLTRTDTTASLQAAGSVGLAAYRPTNATAAQVVRVTGYSVTTGQ